MYDLKKREDVIGVMHHSWREHVMHVIPLPQHQFSPATVGTTDRNTTPHQPPIFVPSPQISVSEDYCLEQQSV